MHKSPLQRNSLRGSFPGLVQELYRTTTVLLTVAGVATIMKQMNVKAIQCSQHLKLMLNLRWGGGVYITIFSKDASPPLLVNK